MHYYLHHIMLHYHLYHLVSTLKIPPGYGPYCFKILGTVHHKIPPVHIDKLCQSSHGQLYILDFFQYNKIRLKKTQNSSFRTDILDIVNQVVINCNSYVKCYKTMHQKTSEESKLALQENREVINFVMHSYHEPQSDSRSFNKPTCSCFGLKQQIQLCT